MKNSEIHFMITAKVLKTHLQQNVKHLMNILKPISSAQVKNTFTGSLQKVSTFLLWDALKQVAVAQPSCYTSMHEYQPSVIS